jgi:hypothetical protein
VATEKRLPIRFGLLTALVWLLVAGGVIFLLWQVITRLPSSSSPISTVTPNQTQINQTIAAIVNTQATSSVVAATQTVTPSPTVKPTATLSTPLPSPNISPTVIIIAATNTPTVLCDQAGAGNPMDVTIPDDSLIPAGQSFVKTWKLVNTGTCTWTTAYSASFFYGDQMGAPENVPLEASVPPNQSVEISVEMIAPQTPGTYQGNWKLMNPEGDLFGIGPSGNQAFWVRIVVAPNQTTQTSTPSITPTTNPTGTPTATVTPPGQVSGELMPIPGDSIDLDAIALNSGDEDLLYQQDENNIHWLNPMGGAKIGVFGNQAPSQADCQSASMSSAPIAVESLPVGTYLCYTTNQGRLGQLLLKAVNPDDFTLTLDLITWALQ